MKKILLILSAVLFFTQMHAQNAWTQKADFGGIARYQAVGFSIGSKGYIGTGDGTLSSFAEKDFWEYDPATNAWTQKADFGGVARYQAVAFSIGSKGYIGTGVDNLYPDYSGASHPNMYKDFWEYDPATNQWTQKADFGGTSRYGATGFSIGSKGYIGTGQDLVGPYGFPSDFWEYDPATDAWTQKANFANRDNVGSGFGKVNATGFSIGSKGYIGTGYQAGDKVTRDFWEYDPATDAWMKKADFAGIVIPASDGFQKVRQYATGFSIGSKGYIGTGRNRVYNSKEFWEYDPTTNQWTQKAAFGGTARHSAVGFSIGSRGYIGTGFDDETGYKKDFWVYDPAPLITLLSASSFCAGDSVTVQFSTDGTYDAGNTFTAQLSDASGSFASPADIGSVSSTVSGSINAAIPASTLAGTAYRIRVVSSDPVFAGTDNGADLTVTAPATYYVDADHDGFGSTTTAILCSPTAPDGYANTNTDCDDNNAAVHPGATEVCNGIDDNCDGQIDEGVKTTFYADADGDGYGDAATTQQDCSMPTGYVTDNTDCDDTNPTINPATFWYLDTDGDGYYTGTTGITSCTSPGTGYKYTGLLGGNDCDDKDALVHTQYPFYVDADGDSYGTGLLVSECAVDANTPPTGYSLNNTDCDDTYATVWRSGVMYTDADGDGYTTGSGTTVCYGAAAPSGYAATRSATDDCDDTNRTVWRSQLLYPDADGDGYTTNNATSVCYGTTIPGGYRAAASTSIDCDDNNAVVHPGAIEVCNGIDDNCDGQIDEGVKTTFYRDGDGDGFGNASVSTQACSAPWGYVSNSTDCDDSRLLYADKDSDGYGAGARVACGVANNTDCDDTKSSVHPGAVEICGNAIDDNCNGQIDENCGSIPRISINDVSVYESEGVAVVTISLDRISTSAISINYATQSGTAIGSGKGAKIFDFTTASGSVTIAAGTKTAQIRITITKDNIAEVAETFKVNLSLDAKNSKKATITKSSGTVTINDGTKPILMSRQAVTTTVTEAVQGFSAVAYPNPSTSSFTIKVSSNNKKDWISMIVTDVLGKVIEKRINLAAGQTITLGSAYRPGVYFVKMLQGKGRTEVKLVKAIY